MLGRKPKKPKFPPLTSERQLEKTKKEINALNKSRSKAMERRIAKVLRGRRVPMSGAAAQYKGDVEIPFENFPGKYIIECKLTAQLKGSEPVMRLQFAWFPKLHEEARNMNAKFGIFVLHYHGNNNDYIFVRIDIIDKLIRVYRTPYGLTLQQLLAVSAILDWRTDGKGKPRVSYSLQRRELESNMINVNGMRGVRAILPDGVYLILQLIDFIAVTEHM